MPTLDPRIWIILILAVALIGAVTTEEIRLAVLRGEVQQKTAENVAQREAVAALKVQLADVATNRDRLQLTITQQNAKVVALEAAARASESAANVRALRVLEKGRAAALSADAGTGSAALNDWLQREFAQ